MLYSHNKEVLLALFVLRLNKATASFVVAYSNIPVAFHIVNNER